MKEKPKIARDPRQTILDKIERERRGNGAKNVLIAFLFLTSTALPFLMFASLQAQIKKPQQVAIIDPAGNLYVSPLKDTDSSQELRDYCAQAAANALLSRNPKGLDYKAVADLVFGPKAAKQLNNEIQDYSKQAARNDLRWKVEFDSIKSQGSLDNLGFVCAITGHVVETGQFGTVFELHPKKFELGLKLTRNGDLLSVGRFPYLVEDYKLVFK